MGYTRSGGISQFLTSEHPVYNALTTGFPNDSIQNFQFNGEVKGGCNGTKDYSADID
jgi:hypothetical protein